MANNNTINVHFQTTGRESLKEAKKDLKAIAAQSIDNYREAKKLATQNKQLNDTFEAMTPQLAKVQREMRRVTNLQQASQKSSRRMELGFQQAGYQFQDLVVQLQGGVNPFVAISQQGSQLASFFAGPWGAMIGLGIAALGMLGTSMMATMGQAKSLSEELASLNEINSALDSFGEKFGENFIGQLDKVRQRFGNFVADVYEFQIRQFQKSISKELESEGGTVFNSFAARATGMTGKAIGRGEGGVIFTRRKKEVEDILALLQDASITTEEEFARVFQNVYDQMESLGYVPEAMLNTLKQISLEHGLQNKLIEEQEGKLRDAADAHIEAYLKRKLAAQEATLEAEKQLEIEKLKSQALWTERKYGEDDVRTRLAQYELTEATLRASLEKKNVDKAIIDSLVQQARSQEEAKDAIEDAKTEAKQLADALKEAEQALNRMSSFGLGLKVSLAQAKAEAVALSTGADVNVAKTIAGKREQALQKYQAARGGPLDTFAKAEYDSQTKILNQLEKIMNENAAETKRQRDAAAGGKKSASDQSKFDEYINQLQRELQLKVSNTKLTDEQIKREEFMAKIREKGIDLGTEASQKQMASVMKLYDKTVELERLTQIIDVIEDNLMTAMMNVVDGTMSVENAFKSMLRTIILEIYKQEVAASAAKGISGFIKGLFMADGGVFSGGRVTPFANGGVVGGPTVFPMSNGVGLMGEAGPEAIMPLKRGRDGKLGVEGGGGVTVVQNINISTGVQQTVRNEIRQMMPQIAESAKSAVLDSKRRGGNYGRSFA